MRKGGGREGGYEKREQRRETALDVWGVGVATSRGVLILVDGSFLLQQVQTQVAAPTSLRRLRHRWGETIHVVATIAVITEEQLVVVLRGAADVAALALDALPAVGLHCCHHHRGELEAGRMP